LRKKVRQRTSGKKAQRREIAQGKQLREEKEKKKPTIREQLWGLKSLPQEHFFKITKDEKLILRRE